MTISTRKKMIVYLLKEESISKTEKMHKEKKEQELRH